MGRGHKVLNIVQDPSYLGGTTLVSIRFTMAMTQIITWVYENSPVLGFPSISIFEWYSNYDTAKFVL